MSSLQTATHGSKWDPPFEATLYAITILFSHTELPYLDHNDTDAPDNSRANAAWNLFKEGISVNGPIMKFQLLQLQSKDKYRSALVRTTLSAPSVTLQRHRLLARIFTGISRLRPTPGNGLSAPAEPLKTEMNGHEEVKSRRSSPESSAGLSDLRRAVDLISSLISLSHSIRVFTGKWQLIRTKLEELHSVLAAAADDENRHHSSGEEPWISGVLPSILSTAEECGDLARRCTDLSYSGKLLMQSDLDVVLAKLRRHGKKVCEMVTKGILRQSQALVVSKPSLGASKEDMRFFVRDLLTRMKVGDVEMKQQALISLHDVVSEDEKYVKVIVEIGDVVPLLVEFLGSSELGIQDHSAKLVSLIAGFDSYKGVLVGAGAIAQLVRVLEFGSEFGKVGAALCLLKLTENSENAWSVSSHGGVTALLRICGDVDSKGGLVAPACGVLRNLVGVEEIKRFMVEEGAVSTFVKLVRSRDEEIQVSSIEFIQSIASGDEAVRQIVVREGGIRALLRVLDPKWPSSSRTRQVVMKAAENLFFDSSSYVSILMSYGFVDQLMYYVRNGEVLVQELALKVAFSLCGTSDEAKKALGDAGLMPELVKFLNAKKSLEVREMAAEALSGLVMVPKNRKRFVQDDHNIALILQMLDPQQGNPGSNKFLISILMSLTNCNSGRKKIVGSGYSKNIERLAEAEVSSSDAKRLVRKLSTNRFRTMLTGFWHS